MRARHAGIRLLCLAAVLCLPIGCGEGGGRGPKPAPGASLETTFQSAVGATGSSYTALRDQLLQSDGAALDAYLSAVRADAAASWDARELAYILQGWRAHEVRYRELLSAERRSTPAGVLHFEWALGPMDDLGEISPLMHELMVKDASGPEGRADAGQVLRRLASDGVDIRAAHLLDGLVASTELGEQRISVAALLGGVASLELPEADVLRALRYEQGESVDGLQNTRAPERHVARPLVNLYTDGARRRIAATGAVEARALGKVQDVWVDALDGLPDLGDTVGEKFLARRLARIGGPRGSELVGLYLESVPLDRPAEHAWGLGQAAELPYSGAMTAYLVNRVLTAQAGFAPAITPAMRDAALDAIAAISAALDETNELDRADLVRLKQALDAVDPQDLAGGALQGRVEGMRNDFSSRLGE